MIVTHNANIVVNGDSELVLSLSPIHGESIISAIGSLQEKEIRKTICSILGGGGIKHLKIVIVGLLQ